jgi:predicted secreted protein
VASPCGVAGKGAVAEALGSCHVQAAIIISVPRMPNVLIKFPTTTLIAFIFSILYLLVCHVKAWYDQHQSL